MSHSHVDNRFAEQLVDDLRAPGADAWFDKKDLSAGSFPARICSAPENCEWFLLVLTQDAATFSWVRQEVEATLVLKHSGNIHELIFVKAGPVEFSELPSLWRTYNAFAATKDLSYGSQRYVVGGGAVVAPLTVPHRASGRFTGASVGASVSAVGIKLRSSRTKSEPRRRKSWALLVEMGESRISL